MCANLLQSTVALAAQLVDLAVQTTHDLQRLVDRGSELLSIALPPVDTIDLGGPAAHLDINLLAKLALCSCGNCLHDELHATRFTDSVLLGAVLSEVSPLPVPAGETVLVEKAHVSGIKSWVV